MMPSFVRQYDPQQDAETVSFWWGLRRETPMPLGLLPPVGVVVITDGEPVCALWMYMSVGIGVAFLENPVAAPGMPPRETAEAFRLAIEALESIALAHDYGVLMCHTPAGIARVLRQQGFVFSDRPVFTGEKYIRPQEAPL